MGFLLFLFGVRVSFLEFFLGGGGGANLFVLASICPIFVWISLLFLFLLLFLVQEFGGRCALKSVEMMFIRVLEGLDPMSGV